MSEKQIYNEGRVVGYSAYELYVKNAIASGIDPTSGDIATEREWLGSMLAMGSSMIVKVPSFEGKFIDIPLPNNTRLCAANTIVASFFDGEAVFGDGNWATKLMRYNPMIANNSVTYPSGEVEATDIPHVSMQSGEERRTVLKQFQDYLKIDKGVILQGGEWTESEDYTSQGVEPHYDLTRVQVDIEQGKPSPIPVLRLYTHHEGSSITHNPMILLTGFTDRNVLRGTSVLSGGTADPSTNDNASGGFLGPEIFPWCTPIVFTMPANYAKFLHGTQTTEQASNISSDYTIFDINADLDDIYGDEENIIYTLYCESTPSDIAGIDMRYKYLSSPTFYTNVLNVYSEYGNYPPALYANFQEPVADGTVTVRHQYPVDVVAPGTVKIFRNNDNDTLIDYESKFVGTTALNLTGGILSMQGSEGLYALNNITSGNTAISVTRNATTGAWEISADTTGQINVAVDSNTKTLTVTPSTSQGVKTFTIKDVQTFTAGDGISIATNNANTTISTNLTNGKGITLSTDSSTKQTTIATNIIGGSGINVSTDSNNRLTITNTMPFISNANRSSLPYDSYYVQYSNGSWLRDADNNNEEFQVASSSTGLIPSGAASYYSNENANRDNYGWAYSAVYVDTIDANHPQPRLGLRYSASRANGVPTSVNIGIGANANLQYDNDSADTKYHVPNYDSTKTYYAGAYCVYNGTQYICTDKTTGSFDSSCWSTDTSVRPSENYNLVVVRAKADGITNVVSTYGTDFRFSHGTKYDELSIVFSATFPEIGSKNYRYYPYDRSIMFRMCFTESACKQMFFGSSDFDLSTLPSKNMLIHFPTSGVSDGLDLSNFMAYSSVSQSGNTRIPSRLSYPVVYRVYCRYPFIVDNRQIRPATYANITANAENRGYLYNKFGTTVTYLFSRDQNGKELTSSYNPYYSADDDVRCAMVLDVVAEQVADGFNGQLRDNINYESKPVSPYIVASRVVNLNTTIVPNILINNN